MSTSSNSQQSKPKKGSRAGSASAPSAPAVSSDASGGSAPSGAGGSSSSNDQRQVVSGQGGASSGSASSTAEEQCRWFEDRLEEEFTRGPRVGGVGLIIQSFMNLFPKTGARRAKCPVDESARISFLDATPEDRAKAFESFLTQCPTANLSDFLAEVLKGSNPDFHYEDEASGASASEGSESGSSENDSEEEEPEVKRPRRSSSPSLSSSPPSSSSSSSSSSFVNSSADSSSSSSSSTSCKFTFDDYVRMSRAPDDMLLPCVEESCSTRRKDHAKQVSESHFKMPPRDAFPTFRDPKDKLMEDPFEFLVKLERQLKLHRVPLDRYGVILVSCLRDRLMQEWVETNIVATCQTWEDMKRRFKEKYDDPEIKNRLMLQLEKCIQSFDERVYEYTERYQSLVVRISAGAPIDTQMNIITCERGFIPELRSELAKFRSMRSQSLGRNFEFNSLSELYQTAATLERGLAPRAGRIKSASGDSRARKRSRRARVSAVEISEKKKPSTQSSSAINKIEMTNGKPVNVNKKHRQRKTTGGGKTSGSRPGGSRPGPPGSTGSAASTSGASAGSSRNQGSSSSSAAAGAAAKPFTGTCFKCGKAGHRIADCRSSK